MTFLGRLRSGQGRAWGAADSSMITSRPPEIKEFPSRGGQRLPWKAADSSADGLPLQWSGARHAWQLTTSHAACRVAFQELEVLLNRRRKPE